MPNLAASATQNEDGPWTVKLATEWAFPIYRMESRTPIFTGPFAVEGFEPSAFIEMTPNTHHVGAEAGPMLACAGSWTPGRWRSLSPRANWTWRSTCLSGRFQCWRRRTGRPSPSPWPASTLWMNTRTPALSDPRVRRAFDLAASRDDLVTAVQAGVPATGAIADSYPFAAEGSLSHDPDAAVSGMAAPSGGEVLRPRLHQRAASRRDRCTRSRPRPCS